MVQRFCSAYHLRSRRDCSGLLPMPTKATRSCYPPAVAVATAGSAKAAVSFPHLQHHQRHHHSSGTERRRNYSAAAAAAAAANNSFIASYNKNAGGVAVGATSPYSTDRYSTLDTFPVATAIAAPRTKWTKMTNRLCFSTTTTNTTTTTISTDVAYHTVADETLEAIQDALDDLLDKQTLIEYEINLAAGVLTIQLPPHGTWVINKQAPNRQLWWSSPLSGPQRFEYNDEQRVWLSTRPDQTTVGGTASTNNNIGECLSQEIHHLFPELDPLELSI